MLFKQKANDKKFATYADEIYVNNIVQVLLDQNNIPNKLTSKGNSYLSIAANKHYHLR